MIDHHICNICQNTSSVIFLPYPADLRASRRKPACPHQKKTLYRCESSLLCPIFTPLVSQRPLVVVVIITAAKEEVRQSRGGGCAGWLNVFWPKPECFYKHKVDLVAESEQTVIVGWRTGTSVVLWFEDVLRTTEVSTEPGPLCSLSLWIIWMYKRKTVQTATAECRIQACFICASVPKRRRLNYRSFMCAGHRYLVVKEIPLQEDEKSCI